MNDLLQATGYAALVYLLFNYLVSFGSGRPLVEWINPGRKYLPLLAGALIGGAFTLLRAASLKHGKPHLELLADLIGAEKAKPEVVGAVSFVTFGAAILMLAGWCWWWLPRSPQTFSSNPRNLVAEYRRALRHYVRWAGGLDYAALCEIRGGVLHVVTEGSADKSILRGLNRLPGVHVAVNSGRGPDVETQKQIWRDLAGDLYGRWRVLNEAVVAARQGVNLAISFDVRYGAIYAEMIEEASSLDGDAPIGVFLLAATLNQHEVSTLTAARHFTMLSQAIRHIRTGVAKG